MRRSKNNKRSDTTDNSSQRVPGPQLHTGDRLFHQRNESIRQCSTGGQRAQHNDGSTMQ